MDVIVRDARLTDDEALAGLSEQLGYPRSPEALRVVLEENLREPRVRILVAEVGGAVVGWVGLEILNRFYTDPYVDITGFVVEASMRNQGIGRRLMAAAEEWARSQGISAVKLKSNKKRTAAHRFYEACGYRLTKEQVCYAKTLEGCSE